jgi:WD40 repeat protein
VRVLDENFNNIASFQAHTDIIYRIEQSPFNNGLYTATASRDSKVKVWYTFNSSWTLVRNYTGHSDMVLGLEWINADTIASSSHDGTIQIWSVSTGSPLLTIEAASAADTLKLLSNGLYLAASLYWPICNIDIYNLTNGKVISTLKGHTSFIRDFVLINNTTLASSSDDKTVRIWDLTANTSKFILNSTSGFFGLKLLDSNTLASGDESAIRVWNITSGNLIKTLSNHTSSIWDTICFLKDDGQTILSGSLDKTIKVWNWKTGECLNTVKFSREITSVSVLNTIKSNLPCFIFEVNFVY